MTQSMVEKVARALAMASLSRETRKAVHIDAHMAHVRGHYEELARAAIEAMREPTDGMVDAGAYWNTIECARHCWQAMIDAALNEEASE